MARSRPRLAASVAGLLAATLAGALLHAPGGHAAPAEERGWIVDRVRFEPAGRALLTVDGVGTYRGALEVTKGPAGVATVNDVALDHYVKGVAEMPASWPLEAQKAQAIAARTYALHQLLSHRTADPDPFADICDSQNCQVYAGVSAERRTFGKQWVEAVDQTTEQVMLSEGKVMFTQYSSTNGGRTVRGSRPYLWAVDDPDDAASPYHRWEVRFPLDRVGALLQLPGAITAAARNGDILLLTLTHPDGATSVSQVHAADVRKRLNDTFPRPPGLPLAVPSVRYLPSVAGTDLVLTGGGWGHGVGLSQYGALGKARRGMTAADILAAYYGFVKPSAVDPRQLPSTIRVGLSAPAEAVGISSHGPFKVLDGTGRALVARGQGAWRVEPAEHGVRVIPPDGYEQPLRAESVAFDPPRPGSTGKAVVHFDLAVPARVKVLVARKVGEAKAVEETTLGPGRHSLRVSAPSRPGKWTIVVEANAGVDHVAAVPLAYEVAAKKQPARVEAATASIATSAEAALAGVDPQPSRKIPALVAALLLAFVSSGIGLRARRAPLD